MAMGGRRGRGRRAGEREWSGERFMTLSV